MPGKSFLVTAPNNETPLVQPERELLKGRIPRKN